MAKTAGPKVKTPETLATLISVSLAKMVERVEKLEQRVDGLVRHMSGRELAVDHRYNDTTRRLCALENKNRDIELTATRGVPYTCPKCKLTVFGQTHQCPEPVEATDRNTLTAENLVLRVENENLRHEVSDLVAKLRRIRNVAGD